jgi:hypothetical protein
MKNNALWNSILLLTIACPLVLHAQWVQTGKPSAGHALLEIFDLAGRKLAMLVSRDLIAGLYRYSLDMRAFAPGNYAARLQMGNQSLVKTIHVR